MMKTLQQIRKWSYFARHAKKARTKKKYKRRIREYAEKYRVKYSGVATGYMYLPSAIELPGRVCRYDSGAPGKDGEKVRWWARTVSRESAYSPTTKKAQRQEG